MRISDWSSDVCASDLYDQSIVGETKQNGKDVPDSVRIVLGTLVLGGSYRFNDHTSLNVALGVGVTDDTPDVSLNVRVPITFCRPAVAVAASTAGRRCLMRSEENKFELQYLMCNSS